MTKDMDTLAVDFINQDQHVKELEDELKAAKALRTEIEDALVGQWSPKSTRALTKTESFCH